LSARRCAWNASVRHAEKVLTQNSFSAHTAVYSGGIAAKAVICLLRLTGSSVRIAVKIGIKLHFNNSLWGVGYEQ